MGRKPGSRLGKDATDPAGTDLDQGCRMPLQEPDCHHSPSTHSAGAVYPATSRPVIIIVGGGFSGTMVAAQLLRGAQARGVEPPRLVLVERRGTLGEGAAYGTTSSAHLLNVAAGGMSALPDDSNHFVRWAQRRDPRVTQSSFLPRSMYGEYLRALLLEAEAAVAPDLRLARIEDEAVDLEELTDHRRLRVHLRDRAPIDCDTVVLATGNLPPACPPLLGDSLAESPVYVRDPWRSLPLDVEPQEPVLLIGTGLTMLDYAVALDEQGHRGTITGISRHGLSPRAHVVRGLDRLNRAELARSCLRVAGLQRRPGTTLSLLRVVRAAIDRGGRRGLGWRDVVAGMRGCTPELWASLDVAERARFLRHLRPYWETFRHQVAPETAERFAAMCASGRAVVLAGRIQSYRTKGSCVEVVARRRGSRERVTVRAARVVNCTGPDARIDQIDHILLRALVERGLLRSDPLGLGVDVGECYGAIRRDGSECERLLVVGPLTRARFWESTAVPELRVHAAGAAGLILRRMLPLGSAVAA